jgi:hypothetical protein
MQDWKPGKGSDEKAGGAKARTFSSIGDPPATPLTSESTARVSASAPLE